MSFAMNSPRPLRVFAGAGLLLALCAVVWAVTGYQTGWHDNTNKEGQICPTFCIQYIATEGESWAVQADPPDVSGEFDGADVPLTPTDSDGNEGGDHPEVKPLPGGGYTVTYCFTYCIPEEDVEPGMKVTVNYSFTDASGNPVNGSSTRTY